MTLSDTIDFLAKNVQAGIVIDFDRPQEDFLGPWKNECLLSQWLTF